MSELRFIFALILAGCFSPGMATPSLAAPPATAPAPQAVADGTAQANARLVAIPPNRSPVDSELIHHAPGGDGTAGSSSAPVSQGVELSRVGLALAIVISLIFALRWGGRKLLGPAMVGNSTRAVQVISRSPISARQSILILRVGKRLIVVGDSGTQMSPLTEITDPDEVAAFVGQVRENQSNYPANGAFGKLFHRAAAEMSADENESVELQEESSELSESTAPDAGIDPAIHETREELTGLMEKIRSLSQSFPKGTG